MLAGSRRGRCELPAKFDDEFAVEFHQRVAVSTATDGQSEPISSHSKCRADANQSQTPRTRPRGPGLSIPRRWRVRRQSLPPRRTYMPRFRAMPIRRSLIREFHRRIPPIRIPIRELPRGRVASLECRSIRSRGAPQGYVPAGMPLHGAGPMYAVPGYPQQNPYGGTDGDALRLQFSARHAASAGSAAGLWKWLRIRGSVWRTGRSGSVRSDGAGGCAVCGQLGAPVGGYAGQVPYGAAVPVGSAPMGTVPTGTIPTGSIPVGKVPETPAEPKFRGSSAAVATVAAKRQQQSQSTLVAAGVGGTLILLAVVLTVIAINSNNTPVAQNSSANHVPPTTSPAGESPSAAPKPERKTKERPQGTTTTSDRVLPDRDVPKPSPPEAMARTANANRTVADADSRANATSTHAAGSPSTTEASAAARTCRQAYTRRVHRARQSAHNCQGGAQPSRTLPRRIKSWIVPTSSPSCRSTGRKWAA